MFIALDVLNQLRISFRSETFIVSSQSHFAPKELMEILKSTGSINIWLLRNQRHTPFRRLRSAALHANASVIHAEKVSTSWWRFGQ